MGLVVAVTFGPCGSARAGCDCPRRKTPEDRGSAGVSYTRDGHRSHRHHLDDAPIGSVLPVKIFHLSEPKHGWVDVTFGEPPDAFTFTVSGVPNDCLRDLAAATARLLRHSTDETVEFSLEPAFAICQLHRELDSVRVVVRHPAHADPAFDATFPLCAFARRVRFELLRIQPRYSAQDGWTRPFPEHEVANLT